MLQMKVGDVASTETVIPNDEFFASRFYREWCEPLGICNSIWAFLRKSVTSYAAVAVLRHDGKASPTKPAAADAPLAPHSSSRRRDREGHRSAQGSKRRRWQTASMGLPLLRSLSMRRGGSPTQTPAARQLLGEGAVLEASLASWWSRTLNPTAFYMTCSLLWRGHRRDIGANGIAVPLWASTALNAGLRTSCRSPPARGARPASPIPPSPLCSRARPRSICRIRWTRLLTPTSSRRRRCACS